jgi:hypothetical protein
MVGSFVALVQFGRPPPGSIYVPAHVEDGKFVPQKYRDGRVTSAPLGSVMAKVHARSRCSIATARKCASAEARWERHQTILKRLRELLQDVPERARRCILLGSFRVVRVGFGAPAGGPL